MLPRGTTTGPAGIAEVDLATGEVIREMTFDGGHYLPSPITGKPPAVRQARGMAVAGGLVYVSLFNSVVVLEIGRSSRTPVLRPVRRYVHDQACDLHGLAVSAAHVAAASTGGDAVIIWERDSGRVAGSVNLSGTAAIQQELNFPEDSPEYRPGVSWRHAVSDTVHVNDVAFAPGGGMFATGLTRIWRIRRDGRANVIHQDSTATFHDCVVLPRQLVVTDAARGALVFVDARTGRVAERVDVVDPADWFLRGVYKRRGRFVVAVSERVPNKQLLLGLPGEPVPLEQPARAGFVTVDARDHRVSEVRGLRLSAFPSGSVLYSLRGAPEDRSAA